VENLYLTWTAEKIRTPPLTSPRLMMENSKVE
jgi:putative transcriptional regulator